jgi:hypothetical protein
MWQMVSRTSDTRRIRSAVRHSWLVEYEEKRLNASPLPQRLGPK